MQTQNYLFPNWVSMKIIHTIFFYIVTYIFPNHRNIIIITFVCDSIVLEMFIKFLDPHSFTAFNVFLHVQRVLCC